MTRRSRIVDDPVATIAHRLNDVGGGIVGDGVTLCRIARRMLEGDDCSNDLIAYVNERRAGCRQVAVTMRDVLGPQRVIQYGGNVVPFRR